MTETYDEIRDDIEGQRGELAGSIQRLETTVKHSLDVRRFVEERPLDVAIIALGAGLFVADFMRRSNGRHAPEYDELTETFTNIRDALMAVGKQQVGAMVQGARAGLQQP